MKNKLKHFRHKYEMNQKEFAEFLGVTQYQLSRWEGQAYQPSLETAYKIAKRLNIKIEDLIEIEDS
jgi:putative transcriptional regulator